MDQDETAIRQLLSDWHRATVAGDRDALLALVCDDVVFYLPGNPPLAGKAMFAAALQANTGFDVDYDWQVSDLAVSGTLAYCSCQLQVRLCERATGLRRHRQGPTLTVLRREADGAWRIARDANLLTPAPEETAP